MALNADQYQQLVATELGKDTDAGFVATVQLYWELYEAQPSLWLRYLHVKRHALRTILLGKADLTDWKEADASENESQAFRQWEQLLRVVEGEIETALAATALTSGYAIGQLTATSPIDAPCAGFDPNDRAYRGDPIRRR